MKLIKLKQEKLVEEKAVAGLVTTKIEYAVEEKHERGRAGLKPAPTGKRPNARPATSGKFSDLPG